jgi:hypothetical protein
MSDTVSMETTRVPSASTMHRSPSTTSLSPFALRNGRKISITLEFEVPVPLLATLTVASSNSFTDMNVATAVITVPIK